jgi:Na+-transporting methylmalonyl-CoA/oxaloacetate decarboxylase gamma subunit
MEKIGKIENKEKFIREKEQTENHKIQFTEKIKRESKKEIEKKEETKELIPIIKQIIHTQTK